MTTKINIEINEDNSMPVKNASYGVKVAQFGITINSTKIAKPYQCPIVFNHTQIPKEQIIADIACYVIANALYLLEFNNFENPKDLQNLADELGYEETEDTTHLVSEIKVFSEALKSITLAQEDKEFIDDYINIEDSLKQATTIVNKYFSVLFISKHYANA